MTHPITWFEINTANPAEMRQWYGDLFGWDVRPIDGMDYSIVDTGGAVGGGIAKAEGNQDVILYVEVADLVTTLERVRNSGGKVVVPVTEIPDMVTFAQFSDPDGNVVGIVEGEPTPADPASPQFVLLYDPADDVLDKAPTHFPAHSARLDDFHARGDLLQVGTLGAAQPEGSMAVFRTREAAEEFVADDPFHLHGVIRGYDIRQWNTAW